MVRPGRIVWNLYLFTPQVAKLRGKELDSSFLPSDDSTVVFQRLLKVASPNGNELLVNGKAPLPGQIIQNGNLAQTFRDLVHQGKDGFYKGRVAQAIIDLIQSKGGLMSLEDLASHTTDIVQPIKYTYAEDVTLYEVRL